MPRSLLAWSHLPRVWWVARADITTRYRDAPNGYALSQSWRPQTMADFHDQRRCHPELADELGVGGGRPLA